MAEFILSASGSKSPLWSDVLASVNGRPIGVFQLNDPGVTRTTSLFSFSSDTSIKDVRLEFINDLFDPATGTDRNVQILAYRVIDGDTGQVTTARTTDSNVFNSGIYRRESELHKALARAVCLQENSTAAHSLKSELPL